MFVPEKTSHCATFAGATRRGGEAAKICFNQGNSGALCPMGSVSIPAHTGGALCPTGSVSIPAHTGGTLCPVGSVSIPAPHGDALCPVESVSIPGPTLGTPAGPLPPQMVSRLPTPPRWRGHLLQLRTTEARTGIP